MIESYLGDVLKTQRFQEAGLLRVQDFFLNIRTAVFCSSILLHFLRVIGGGFVGVGGGFVELQGGAKGERFVAAIADEPVELADTATKVCLAPDLKGKRAGLIPTLKTDGTT